MNKIKCFYNKHKEIILYTIFGIATTLIDALVFMLFDYIFNSDLSLLSTFIAWAVATVFAYFVNKIFVFESHSWQEDVVKRESLEFAITRLFCLGISALGMFLLVTVGPFGTIAGFRFMGIAITGNLIAKLIMSVVAFVLNYFFGKLIVFKKNNEKPQNEVEPNEESVQL